MRYWPVGDYFDNTTRMVGGSESFEGYEVESAAWAVITRILAGQSKPHHVTYRVESAPSLAALEATGVFV